MPEAARPDPVIRDAADADGPRLADLIRTVFGEYEDCPFVPGEFPELAAPASHFAALGGRLWVVEANGIVGSLAVAPSWKAGEAELFKVYLAREWRGRGLAGRLLDLALAWAREHGVRRVGLWSDTRFADGHRFYRRQAFLQHPGARALHDAGRTFEYRFTKVLD